MKHARTIYSVFDFYASLGSSGDFTTIAFNAFKQFVQDMELAIDRSKHCDDSHLDQLFIQVNSAGALAAAAKARATGIKTQGARSFGRAETLNMLVRVAISRFILEGDEVDISQAVVRLCEHMTARLVPQAKHHADHFRGSMCYNEGVSRILGCHRQSLLNIFETYADFGNLRPAGAKLLGYDDWLLLLKHLQL